MALSIAGTLSDQGGRPIGRLTATLTCTGRTLKRSAIRCSSSSTVSSDFWGFGGADLAAFFDTLGTTTLRMSRRYEAIRAESRGAGETVELTG